MAGLSITVRRDRRRQHSREALKNYVFEQLKTLWRDCVSAFILEAIQHVHVDTGMSEASFYDLATNVRLASAVMANIRGKGPTPPHLRYDGQEGVKKSIPLGKELGSDGKAYKLRFGDARQPKFVFEFNLVIYQYKLHEYGQQAWNSLEYGKAAFLSTWHNEFKYRVSMSKLVDWLTP